MQRIEGSGVPGTREATGMRPAEARGGRPADSGVPTVFKECQHLTKEERPCKAPPVEGLAFCVGHARQKGLLNGNKE